MICGHAWAKLCLDMCVHGHACRHVCRYVCVWICVCVDRPLMHHSQHIHAMPPLLAYRCMCACLCVHTHDCMCMLMCVHACLLAHARTWPPIHVLCTRVSVNVACPWMEPHLLVHPRPSCREAWWDDLCRHGHVHGHVDRHDFAGPDIIEKNLAYYHHHHDHDHHCHYTS